MKRLAVVLALCLFLTLGFAGVTSFAQMGGDKPAKEAPPADGAKAEKKKMPEGLVEKKETPKPADPAAQKPPVEAQPQINPEDLGKDEPVEAPADPNAKTGELSIEDKEYVDSLLVDLKSRKYEDRLKAAEDLADLGIKIGPKLDPFLKDKDLRIRRITLEIMGKIKYAGTIDQVQDMYLNDPDGSVREQAYVTLIKYNGPAATFFVKQLLHSKQEIREQAAQALLQTWVNSMPILDKALENEKDQVLLEEVKKLYRAKTYALLFSLVRGWDAATKFQLGHTLAKFALMADENMRHKYFAKEVKKIGKIGYQTMLEFLADKDKMCFQWFQNAQQCYQLRVSAIKVLTNLETPESLETILSYIKDENSNVRLEVMKAIIARKPANMMELLKKYETDDDPGLIQQLIFEYFETRAMGVNKDTGDIFPQFIEYMKDTKREPKNRYAIIVGVNQVATILFENRTARRKSEMLLEMDKVCTSLNKELPVALLELFKEDNEDVKKGVMIGLVNYNTDEVNKSAEEVVLNRKYSLELRIQALALITSHAYKETPRICETLLTEGNLELQSQAIYSIAMVRAADKADKIIPFLDHDSWKLRQYSIFALSSLGCYKVQKKFLALLKDKKPEVSEQAMWGLVRLAAPLFDREWEFDVISADDLQQDQEAAANTMKGWWEETVVPLLSKRGIKYE